MWGLTVKTGGGVGRQVLGARRRSLGVKVTFPTAPTSSYNLKWPFKNPNVGYIIHGPFNWRVFIYVCVWLPGLSTTWRRPIHCFTKRRVWNISEWQEVKEISMGIPTESFESIFTFFFCLSLLSNLHTKEERNEPDLYGSSEDAGHTIYFSTPNFQSF